jgi:Rieske Fe-S protein
MSLPRRRFLALSGCALAGALPACASLASVALPAPGGFVRVVPRNHPGLDGTGGFLKVLPEGWDVPIYVLRDASGGFAALSPVCTHLGCVVEVEGALLVCPCHGSTYERDGRVVQGPAEAALLRFPLEEQADGSLAIDVRRGEM